MWNFFQVPCRKYASWKILTNFFSLSTVTKYFILLLQDTCDINLEILTMALNSNDDLFPKIIFKTVRNNHRRYSSKKKVSLKVTQILQEDSRVGGIQTFNFIKKSFQHRCFPVKFANFLRISVLKSTCEHLLLNLNLSYKVLLIDPLKSLIGWREYRNSKFHAKTM